MEHLHSLCGQGKPVMFLQILDVIKVLQGIESNYCGENLGVMPKKNQPQENKTEDHDERHPINVHGMAIKPPGPSHTKTNSGGTEQQPERPDFSETSYRSLASIHRIARTRESW